MHIHKLINYEISEYYTRGPAKLKKEEKILHGACTIRASGLGRVKSVAVVLG